MSSGVQVEYTLFLSDFNETRIFSTGFFEKYSHMKFHESPRTPNKKCVYIA